MYFPKPSLNENDLAIIERGATAIHSIEAGKYVSWHGRTGKAKAAILQGATLDNTLFDYDEDGVINAQRMKELPLSWGSGIGGVYHLFANDDYAILLMENAFASKSITTEGVELPVTAKYRALVPCVYYNGSSNVMGIIELLSNKLYLQPIAISGKISGSWINTSFAFLIE